jgi:hypothetical protein
MGRDEYKDIKRKGATLGKILGWDMQGRISKNCKKTS